MTKYWFILILSAYFYWCYRNVSINRKKYLRKTYIWFALILVAIFIYAIIMGADVLNSVISLLIAKSVLFGLNTLFYNIAKKLRKEDLEKEAKSFEQEIKNQKQEKTNQELENEDMKKMKQLMSEITQKINQLDKFNKDINLKIRELEAIGSNAVAEVYGDLAIGIPKEKYYGFYDKIYERYSSSVDSIVSMQCDNIVKKVASAVEEKKKIIKNNLQDKYKYENIKKALQQQYKNELKIQKMKVINQNVNALTDSTSDITNALNSRNLLEKSREEFNQLNTEIETRRQLEVKYSTIEI